MASFQSKDNRTPTRNNKYLYSECVIYRKLHEMANYSLIKELLGHLPKKHMNFAFAYGSAVFQQTGHKDVSKNMIDFVVAVDEPVEWHKENLARNSKHYSFLKYLGAKSLAHIQENWGARVYFNTMVPCEGRLMKYGVISTESLKNDLLDWETLYIAGRLHKPVLVVRGPKDNDLAQAIQTNYESAVHTALLLLSDVFSEEEFYLTIAGLSYNGDFRMTVGEDKNKVANIVRPNIAEFRKLYSPILEKNSEHIHCNKSRGMFEQCLEPASQYHHLSLLPKMLQVGLVNHRNSDGHFRDTEEVLRAYAHDSGVGEDLSRCTAGIVSQSSQSQSIKTILTAGLRKSVVYSWKKVKKMLRSQA